MVQGFLQLLEPEVIIHVREVDANIAKQAADGASKQYFEISGRQVKYEVVTSLSSDLYAKLPTSPTSAHVLSAVLAA